MTKVSPEFAVKARQDQHDDRRDERATRVADRNPAVLVDRHDRRQGRGGSAGSRWSGSAPGPASGRTSWTRWQRCPGHGRRCSGRPGTRRAKFEALEAAWSATVSAMTRCRDVVVPLGAGRAGGGGHGAACAECHTCGRVEQHSGCPRWSVMDAIKLDGVTRGSTCVRRGTVAHLVEDPVVRLLQPVLEGDGRRPAEALADERVVAVATTDALGRRRGCSCASA